MNLEIEGIINMAKSKVIKELANNEINIDVALNRLLIIAADIENEDLFNWAEKELNGYTSDDVIPEYRIIKNTKFVYSGINGGYKMNNVPLLLIETLQLDHSDLYIHCNEGIDTVTGIAKSDNDLKYGRDLTHFAYSIYESTGIQCYSIRQIVSKNSFENILNVVKTMLLKIFIELDKTYGNLDDLDIDISDMATEKVKNINSTINQFIYNDNSIKIGDKNKISDSRITAQGVTDDEE